MKHTLAGKVKSRIHAAWKQASALSLAILLCVQLLPITAQAADDWDGKIVTFAPKHATDMRLDLVGDGTANSTQFQIYHPTENDVQLFRLRKLGTGTLDGKATDYYAILSLHASGKALDTSGNNTEAARPHLWDYSESNSNQPWYLVDAGDGYYSIVPRIKTTLCLEVQGGKTSDRTAVILSKRKTSGTDNQRWKLIAADGAFEGQAVKNTYIFEVSSGSRRGGGTADNILYFNICYTTTDGFSRSSILFPGVDALSNGFDAASAVGNRTVRRGLVESSFGYTTAALNAKQALGSVQTDQLMFTTPAPIQSIDKIQIFGRTTKSASDWSCQGMRIHRVDTLYGLEMYGWYSADGYIDFAGEVIAEVEMSGGAGTFRWNNSGGMFSITASGTGSGAAGLSIRSSGGNVGKKHTSQAVENSYVFRMDFADVSGAGFESLTWLQQLGSGTKISDLKLCESAAVVMRYKDVYGDQRQVALPLVINALGQIVADSALGDVSIAGFAQQGDCIAFSAMLPDFEELTSVSLALGEESARAAVGLTTQATDAVHSSRAAKSATDDITYMCFAIYHTADYSVKLDGATLRYEFSDRQPPMSVSVGSSSGILCEAGQTKLLTMRSWREGMDLVPVDRQERYLLTLSTDNVANAGTSSDIMLKFNYVSMENRELETAEYNIREYVQSFYGEWPGNVDNFAYRYGLRDGGTVRFIIPLQRVKEFKNMSLRVVGDDEWQFSGLSIAMVDSCSARYVTWEDISSGALASQVRYDRRVETQSVSFRVGDVYDPGGERPSPADSDWNPGTLIQDDGAEHTFDGDSIVDTVSKKEDIDWSELRHYMTYEDTKQDLGFIKERCLYTVSVYVAGDKTNADDDDCGSKNLFYFRLLFENGNSGCTQANQQIVGDAFRTGMTVSFKVPTTQDYGELTAIQVIPDDQDGNGDIYDKLKIEKIEVVRESSAALSPTWVAASDGNDGLGWVGIDYRDPGEITSGRGAEGRSVSEIATTYQITGSSYSARLLVSITTGAYEQNTVRDKDGNVYAVNDNIFTGGLSASFNYFNNEGRLVSMGPVDVVEAINSYANRTGTKIRTVQYDDGSGRSETQAMDFYVSDPSYHFRPGTTDSFVLTVSNIRELTDMVLLIRSSVVTKWNITSVNVYLVNGTGVRYLNANGEYDYRYREGEAPSFITSWNMDETLSTQVTVYRKEQNDSIIAVNIPFESNPVNLSPDASKWTSKISREPKSKDDTVNLYIYPATGEGYTDPASYDLTAAIRYINANTKKSVQVSTGKMQLTTDDSGRPVFYAVGLNTSYMEGINGIDVGGQSLRSIQAPISYGILERVRGGVLIETHRLNGVADAGLGGTMGISTRQSDDSVQRVLLQVSDTTDRQKLTAEENDLALALYFRASTPFSQELRSKYIYLTDQGYTELRPGQMLELDFCLGDVSEITGINLVSQGSLNLTFTNIFVANQPANGEADKKWSTQSAIVPSIRPTRYDFAGSAELLTIELQTAEDAAASFSGTTEPVRLTVGYYNSMGILRSETYSDIRPYTSSGKGFAAGETETLRLLLPEFDELRWVEVEPVHESGSADASWKLAKLTAKVGFDGQPITKMLNQMIVEGEPLHIALAEVLIAGTITVETKAETAESESTKQSAFTGDEISVVLNSGERAAASMRVSGSTEGFAAALLSYDPLTGATGRASLNPTHGYSEARLAEIRASAQAVLNDSESVPEEAQAAQSVLDCVAELERSSGDFSVTETGLVFEAPRNYTGGSMYYRIIISSNEDPDVAITVNIAVKHEAEQLTAAISRLETARTNAALKKQAAAANSYNGTNSEYAEAGGSDG